MQPADPRGGEPEERTPDQVRANWVQRRRDRIYTEIQRNRRGDYKVPTWVLVLALLAVIAALVTLALSG